MRYEVAESGGKAAGPIAGRRVAEKCRGMAEKCRGSVTTAGEAGSMPTSALAACQGPATAAWAGARPVEHTNFFQDAQDNHQGQQVRTTHT